MALTQLKTTYAGHSKSINAFGIENKEKEPVSKGEVSLTHLLNHEASGHCKDQMSNKWK